MVSTSKVFKKCADPCSRYLQEQEMRMKDEEVEIESSHSSCPAYAELLEVMERAMARLDLPWKRAKKVAPWGRLDECYLSDHSPPAQVSLPFLPDLHVEIKKAWKSQFSSLIHRFQHTSYVNIEGMHENGYEKTPPYWRDASLLSLYGRDIFS